MLQKVSTHLIIPEASEDLIVNEPWSIEFYADGLMDELFADIDDILDVHLPHLTNTRGRKMRQASPVSRTKETAASDWFLSSSDSSHQKAIEYGHLQTVDVPQIVLPSALNRTVQTVAPVLSKGGKVVVDSQSAKPLAKIGQQSQLGLGKLLIVGTTIGVAIAGVLYIVQSGLLFRLTARLTQPDIYVPQAQLPRQVDVEGDLANYMLGALAVIDKSDIQNLQPARSAVGNRVAYSPTALALNNQPPVGNLPSPVTANNTPPTPSRPNVVERIYIPVYQAPLPMRYAPLPIPGVGSPLPPIANNSATNQPNIVKDTLKQVQPTAKPASVNMLASAVRSELKPVPVRNAPINIQQTPKLLPTLPVVPFGASLPQQPNTGGEALPVAAVTVNPPAPAPTHTLEGLMELGNKSVALFQVNGASRRISIGETIGASGWTLVDVNNGEAIVRRNGEVRSIYAGQKL